MPRIARIVWPGLPHHVTQRGNRREQVFFTDSDRHVYLSWLHDYSVKHAVEVLAYCLMTNHVHLVVVPANAQALQRALKPLHMRYAQRVNHAHDWKGHLWQGRFFSSVLDEAYVWAAIRYVELNPVRAKMVHRAEDYPWSSAQAHCGLRLDPVLTVLPSWQQFLQQIADWSNWLGEGDEQHRADILRRHVTMGLPCGSPAFIETLEQGSGRQLQYRSRGRPGKGIEKG